MSTASAGAMGDRKYVSWSVFEPFRTSINFSSFYEEEVRANNNVISPIVLGSRHPVVGAGTGNSDGGNDPTGALQQQ